MDILHNMAIFSNFLPYNQGNNSLQTFAGKVATMDFADTLVTCTILQYHQIPGKKRTMGTTHIKEHAIMACNGNHLHLRYNRGFSVHVDPPYSYKK